MLRGKADVALQEGGEKRFEVRSAGTAGCQGSRCGGDWCGSGDRYRRESNSDGGCECRDTADGVPHGVSGMS